MSLESIIFAVIMPVAALVLSLFTAFRVMKKTRNAKTAIVRHLIVLGLSLTVLFVFAMAVSAEETGDANAAQTVSTTQVTDETAASDGAGVATGLGFVGAGLSIGLAAVGAGIALSAGAPAAIGAVAEDPKSFGKSMIFVALGEAVAIYGFIIAFMMILKIPDLPTL